MERPFPALGLLHSVTEEAPPTPLQLPRAPWAPLQPPRAPWAPPANINSPYREQHNDSGYGVDLAPEDDSDVTANESLGSSHAHLARDITLGSRHSEPGPSPSPRCVGLSRAQRCRESLRALRRRSGDFLRPACLRPAGRGPQGGEGEDMAAAQTRSFGRQRFKSIPAVRSLRRQDELDGRGSLGGDGLGSLGEDCMGSLRGDKGDGRGSRDSMGSLRVRCRSMHSSPSASTLQSVDPAGAIWMNSPTESSRGSPPPPHQDLCGVYRRVLSCLVNPLGCADRKPGCSPLELAAHLREIFQVEEEIHDSFTEELRNIKPCNVVVSVTVVEARDLKPSPTPEYTNPYCVIALDSAGGGTPPKGSPNGSPRTSPVCRRRSGASFDNVDEPTQTELMKSTVHPHWKELFELPVKDLSQQVLHVCVMNSSTQSSQTEMERSRSGSQRRTSFKGLFGRIRLSMDNSRNVSHLGQTRIALRDIPAAGCDSWFPLFKDKRQRVPHQGQLRLRLQLAYKQSEGAVDRGSVEEFHTVVRQVYRHALSSVSPHSSSPQLTPPVLTSEPFGRVTERSRMILSQFAIHSCLSQLTQHIIELSVLLELKVDAQYAVLVSDKLLRERIALVTEECGGGEGGADLPLSEAERALINDALALYLRSIRSDIRITSPLFPPRDLHLDQLSTQVGIPASLLSLPLWSHSPDNIQARQEFTSVFIHRLQDDVKRWLSARLDGVSSSEKDAVLPKTRLFNSVLQEAAGVLTPIISIHDYFHKLSLDYFKVASMMMEVKLSSMAQELTLEMDRYQLKYLRFDVNIRDSSVLSLEHYLQLRAVYRAICTNVSERELFRICMSRYQEWFKGAVTFWLQTFREECQKRMEKALALDKDVAQIAAQVKCSNSCVDILSSFAKMTGEWKQIDFQDVDIALLGVTKITDMICDCVKLYAEKVREILESNGYYDDIDNQQFDVTDQLCTSLNNVDHLSAYLLNLSSLLGWADVTQQLAVKHESDDVGQAALTALETLVQSTKDEMVETGRRLTAPIIHLIALDLRKYTSVFTRNPDLSANNQRDVEPLLDYLESNLKVLAGKLETTIFSLFLEEIWKKQLGIFSDTLMQGQPKEYYEKMLMHLRSLEHYFAGDCAGGESCTGGEGCKGREGCRGGEGLRGVMTSSCQTYARLVRSLEGNALSSEALILQYYKSLTELTTKPTMYFGHLVLKVGYRRETEGFVTIHIKIVQGKYLPGMSTRDLSNPLVAMTLCPLTLFPSQPQRRTSVLSNTVSPVYNEAFEFSGVSEEHRSVEGAVLSLAVWHHNALLPNDFLGEVVLPLARLRELGALEGVDALPAVMMPLRRPREPSSGPYKVLKDRVPNDRVAEQLLQQRSSTVAFHARCRLCAPMKCIVSTLTGRKLDVVGTRSSITVTTEE